MEAWAALLPQNLCTCTCRDLKTIQSTRLLQKTLLESFKQRKSVVYSFCGNKINFPPCLS